MSTKMQQKVSCNATKQPVTFLATSINEGKQLKELGNWIKQHREKVKLSQETAAEKAGLSRYQWMRIENGQSGTKRDTLIQIANVINADVNQTLKRGGFVSALIDKDSYPNLHLPEKILQVDFSIFDESELDEIIDFIQFKARQKVALESPSEERLARLKAYKQRLLDVNYTEEKADAIIKLFTEAYVKPENLLIDIEAKELATKSKKKIPIGKDTDIAEKAA